MNLITFWHPFLAEVCNAAIMNAVAWKQRNYSSCGTGEVALSGWSSQHFSFLRSVFFNLSGVPLFILFCAYSVPTSDPSLLQAWNASSLKGNSNKRINVRDTKAVRKALLEENLTSVQPTWMFHRCSALPGSSH